MTGELLIEHALTALVAVVLGWLVSSARKISPKQLKEFEERIVDPICERLERVESELKTFCTRGELKESVDRMERASEINRKENRENFRQLFDKVEQRRAVW